LYANKHWRNQISVNKGNTKRLWRTLHGVLGDSARNDDSPYSADNFAKYFKDKVHSVRASTAATPLYNVPRRVTSSLADFTAVTVNEVAKLISSAPNKTRQLDPAPTWLVKDMIGLLSPFITLLINKSLTTGCFPGEFKEAIVRPLLKRDGLDLTDLKNYRPVSNLPFLFKLLVQARLQAHLDGSSVLPGWQSAYRRLHSTNTVVTEVFNDLLVAVDRGQMSALSP